MFKKIMIGATKGYIFGWSIVITGLYFEDQIDKKVNSFFDLFENKNLKKNWKK